MKTEKEIIEKTEEDLPKDFDIHKRVFCLADIRTRQYEVLSLQEKQIKEKVDSFLEIDSYSYRKVINHRRLCDCWKEMKPCIMCWGGGLRKFEESTLKELKTFLFRRKI